MTPAVVIPAYKPGSALPALVAELRNRGFDPIIVVDDGSGPEYTSHFESLPAVVLRHAVNLGKGAALKTAFHHVLLQTGGGAVTADADGQHAADDIETVAKALTAHPADLVLGAREFSGDVPLRSRLGNALTRKAMRFLIGRRISDTQTGLRGIPRDLLPHLLRLDSNGYEFELDMLIRAKHMGVAVREVPIRTIYEQGNPSSHFNPLVDSMRIYFVLLRFTAVSLFTAIVDNAAFIAAFWSIGAVAPSQIIGRSAAVLFNYAAARRAVFLSNARHSIVLPRYLALVVMSGAVSYALIQLLVTRFGVPVVTAKVLAEGTLFLANFLVQRDLVFTRRRQSGPAATDWTAYYSKVPATAKLTRKYTSSVLIDALRSNGAERAVLVEIGGANSCFLDAILARVKPSTYHVVDTNEYGLTLLRERLDERAPVKIHSGDVLALDLPAEADAVFSVGLIEHFDPPATRQAIHAHFDLLKPGGTAVISFPTPTLLYRVARALCEAAGLWKFPDERPLSREEVVRSIAERGQIISEKMLWPLVFTQRMVVAKKLR